MNQSKEHYARLALEAHISQELNWDDQAEITRRVLYWLLDFEAIAPEWEPAVREFYDRLDSWSQSNSWSKLNT